MKVKDLLIELQKADPEADLVFSHGEGCCGDRDWLELLDAEFNEHLQFNLKGELVRPKDFPNGTFEFFFATPTYLASCRKAGAVRDLIRKMDEDTAAWHKSQEEKRGKKED